MLVALGPKNCNTLKFAASQAAVYGHPHARSYRVENTEGKGGRIIITGMRSSADHWDAGTHPND